MEKEKKQFTISDYIVVIVGFLVMMALVVFWSTPAHASTYTYKLTENDEGMVDWYKNHYADVVEDTKHVCDLSQFKYKAITSTGSQWQLYVSECPIYCINGSSYASTYAKMLYFDRDSSGEYHMKYNNWNVVNDSDYHSFGSGNLIYADHDVKVATVDSSTGKVYTTDSLFFLRTPLAVVIKSLPKTVGVQVETIVTVAVCCLALLIGSLVLLPKLRIYLS